MSAPTSALVDDMLGDVPADKEYYIAPEIRRQIYQTCGQANNAYGLFHALMPVVGVVGLQWLSSYVSAWHALWLVPALGLAYYRLYFPLHDMSHYTLFTTKTLNRVFGYLLGGLLVTPFESFRREHAYHHAHFSTDKDPGGVDYLVQFKTRGEMLRFLLSPLWGANLLVKLRDYFRQVVGVDRGLARRDQREQPDLVGYASIIIVQLAVLGIVTNGYTIADVWRYPLFVLLPGATVFLFFSRLRMFLEHASLDYASFTYQDKPRKMSRSFDCNWLEGFVLSGASFKYHYEHHLLPTVPAYGLRRVHTDYTANVGDADSFRPSYLGALKALWRNLPA